MCKRDGERDIREVRDEAGAALLAILGVTFQVRTFTIAHLWCVLLCVFPTDIRARERLLAITGFRESTCQAT